MNDAEIITKLEKICFPQSYWSRTSVESEFSREGILYSIIHDEQSEPVGYFIASQIIDEIELYRIGVLPDNRGKGYGKRLMNALIAACKGSANRIFLEVDENNHAAIALYEQFGFKRISERRRYYGESSALIYQLEFFD